MKNPRFYVQGLNKNLVLSLGYSRNFPRYFKLSYVVDRSSKKVEGKFRSMALVTRDTILDLFRKYAGHLLQ